MFIHNKLECSSLADLLSLVGKAGPRKEHLKGASHGKAGALLANIRLGCKGLIDIDKHSCLLRTSINFGREKFYNFWAWSALPEPSPPARPRGHDLGTLPELKMTGSVNSENFELITLLA
jgi:hypothetical protein